MPGALESAAIFPPGDVRIGLSDLNDVDPGEACARYLRAVYEVAQRRGSYDKAAVLTVACAETLRVQGDEKAAGLLVEEIRNRFPRHRAFQAN